jgi:hypothetical protein
MWPIIVGALVMPMLWDHPAWRRLVMSAIVMCSLQVIDYWIPPRPPVDFLRFAIRTFLMPVGMIVGLAFASPWLSQYLPQQLAYGTLGFATFMLLFKIGPAVGAPKRTDKLWQWILVSVGFGILWAYVGSWGDAQ